MNPNKKKVHKYLINASSDINFLKRIIMLNGILEPAPCKLDFFSFICKTIISQQISFKVANKIWHDLTFEKVKNTKFINFFNEEANRKKIYDHLIHSNFVDSLQTSSCNYDLFIAADSLIYLGDLYELFFAVKEFPPRWHIQQRKKSLAHY